MVTFSTQEIDIASDPITLLIKNRVMEKATQLLSEVEQKIKIHVNELSLPGEINTVNGKISKGENYKYLPYAILDFPALFSKDDVFAIRTMFYWGNFISFTIHLKGKYLSKFGESIVTHFSTLKDYYFCVNNTEWEYTYSDRNYRPLQMISQTEIDYQIEEHSFVKISYHFSIEEVHQTEEYLSRFINELKKALKTIK